MPAPKKEPPLAVGVDENKFKEAVRKLLNTPPQHRLAKKGRPTRRPRKKSAS